MSEFSPNASNQDGPGPLEELWLRLRSHAHWFPYASEEVHSVVESLRSAIDPGAIPADKQGAVLARVADYCFRYALSEGVWLCVPTELPGSVGSTAAGNPDGRLTALSSSVQSVLATWVHLQAVGEELPEPPTQDSPKRDVEIHYSLPPDELESLGAVGRLLGLSTEQMVRELLISYTTPTLERQVDSRAHLEAIYQRMGWEFRIEDLEVQRPPHYGALFGRSDTPTSSAVRDYQVLSLSPVELRNASNLAAAQNLNLSELLEGIVGRYLSQEQ